MNTVQDKEFDTFFKDKLQGIEAMPDPSLWDKIETQLPAGTGQRKTRKGFWYAAAAGVLLFIGTSLFYIQNKQTEEQRLQSAKPAYVLRKAVPKPSARVDAPAGLTEPVSLQPAVKPLVQAYTGVKSSRPAGSKPGRGLSLEIESPVRDAVKQEKLALLNIESPAPLVHELEEPLSRLPQLAVTPVRERRKINSLSDVVNLLIQAVDSREEKFIQFSDSNGSSVVSAINLSFIKYKADKENQ